MRIAVVSDTHRNLYAINKVINKIKNADVLIHLGDNVEDVEKLKEGFEGEVYSVKGNCDFSSKIPASICEIIQGKKIFITHGHKYNVKFGMNSIIYKGMEEEADIVLYGHTHIAHMKNEEGIWFINPGSAGNPRMARATIAIIDINEGNINPMIVEI